MVSSETHIFGVREASIGRSELSVPLSADFKSAIYIWPAPLPIAIWRGNSTVFLCDESSTLTYKHYVQRIKIARSSIIRRAAQGTEGVGAAD